MVSPELLRRYGFFAGLKEKQLKEIAMIAEEAAFNKGDTIFEECDEARALFLLQNGSVDLLFRSEEEFYPESPKEFNVGEINPGEAFGISALLAPYTFSATARAAQKCNTIKLDAIRMRKLMGADAALGYCIMVHTAKTLLERLGATRVQLAAAWAD